MPLDPGLFSLSRRPALALSAPSLPHSSLLPIHMPLPCFPQLPPFLHSSAAQRFIAKGNNQQILRDAMQRIEERAYTLAEAGLADPDNDLNPQSYACLCSRLSALTRHLYAHRVRFWFCFCFSDNPSVFPWCSTAFRIQVGSGLFLRLVDGSLVLVTENNTNNSDEDDIEVEVCRMPCRCGFAATPRAPLTVA